MSLPGVYNIAINKGSTFVRSFQLKTDLGVPIPINPAYVGRGAIKIKATDEESIALIDVTIPDADAGRVDIKVAANAFGTWSPKGKTYLELTSAVYDVELYDPADPTDVMRFLNGACTISPEVTT